MIMMTFSVNRSGRKKKPFAPGVYTLFNFQRNGYIPYFNLHPNKRNYIPFALRGNPLRKVIDKPL